MKYPVIVTLILIHHFADLHSMQYLLAPHDFVTFIFGKKTLLECEVESFLKTISTTHCTTEEQLKIFVTKETKEHFKDKLASSYLFFAYMMMNSTIRNRPDFLDENSQINLFVTAKAKKLKPCEDTASLKIFPNEKGDDSTF